MSNRTNGPIDQSSPPNRLARSIMVADAKRMLRMKDPMTIEEVARALRLRYLVVRRLVLSGKLRSKKLLSRHFIERADVERAALEKPWSPWAMRKFKPAGPRQHGH